MQFEWFLAADNQLIVKWRDARLACHEGIMGRAEAVRAQSKIGPRRTDC